MNKYERDTKVNWLHVGVFYVIACAWSWPFFWWRDIETESWIALGLPPYVKNWLIMTGPAIAAIISLSVFRLWGTGKITFFGGRHWWRGLASFSLMFIILSLVERNAQYLLFIPIGFVSMMGEEIGWRGYLQNILRPMKPWKKYVLIGVMWEAWHFTNRTSHGSLQEISGRVAIFICFLIFLSAIVGWMVERTNSVVMAATFHAIVDMAMTGDAPHGWQASLIFAPIFFWIVYKWPRENTGVLESL